jgi:hypothetical protein
VLNILQDQLQNYLFKLINIFVVWKKNKQTNPTPIKYLGLSFGKYSVDSVTIRQN